MCINEVNRRSLAKTSFPHAVSQPHLPQSTGYTEFIMKILNSHLMKTGT